MSKSLRSPSPQRYQGDINKMVEAARTAMPNVADMAAGGIKMTNAFVAHPVCGPSRAGILLGALLQVLALTVTMMRC